MAPLRSFCSLFFLLCLLTLFSHHLSSASHPPQRSPLHPPLHHPPPPPPPPQEARHRTSLLAPILSNLGFQELSMAVAALYSPVLSSWPGPVTLFAPSDDSVRSCSSCSVPRLLREHIVPGLFSRTYLSKLSSGSKLESASPNRCLTITSTNAVPTPDLDFDPSDIKIYVNGVEITRPDLFNDGQIVIHGIQGFIAPLSPSSCFQDSFHSFFPQIDIPDPDRQGKVIMRLMLRDAIRRLRDGGYSILAIAMRIKYAELAGLTNMTVFALSDAAIFAGGHEYLTNVRFHVVPNRILMRSDLMNLKQGTVLPTLIQGQHLVMTQAGAEPRINHVPVMGFDVVYNGRIVVHSIFLPFPHLFLADLASQEAILGTAGGDFFEDINRLETGGGIGTCQDSNAVEMGDRRRLTPAEAPVISAVEDLDSGY